MSKKYTGKPAVSLTATEISNSWSAYPQLEKENIPITAVGEGIFFNDSCLYNNFI
ncbi:hypothetical protein [Alteribacillus persepolensis]|uniref:hypothetical protein n=1 Tax=Alteribacillus persepolensis TaxID=568899 RepID=UPI001586FCB9|nr:hypothetical protein [Alteribacillus persepolensis]